jgi:hypothetical protein
VEYLRPERIAERLRAVVVVAIVVRDALESLQLHREQIRRPCCRDPQTEALGRWIQPQQNAIGRSLAASRIHRDVFAQPGTWKPELRGCIGRCRHDQAMAAVARHSCVDISRSPPPVELEQDRAPAVDRDFSESLSVEEILPHQPKGLLDHLPVKQSGLVHRQFRPAPFGTTLLSCRSASRYR